MNPMLMWPIRLPKNPKHEDPRDSIPKAPKLTGSRKRAKKNVGLYLDLGRERLLDQVRINREHSAKALGITTFGVTLFTIGISGSFDSHPSSLEWVLLSLLGLFGIGIAALSIGIVLRPQAWTQPFDLSNIYQLLGELKPDSLTLSAGYMYEHAVRQNHTLLETRGNALNWMAILALMDLVAFVALKVTSAIP